MVVESRSVSGENQQSADTGSNASFRVVQQLSMDLGTYLNHSCLWRMADLLEVI